jgi:hypothetical protein
MATFGRLGTAVFAASDKEREMKQLEKLLALTGVLVAALMTSCVSPTRTSGAEAAKAQSAESAKAKSQSAALLPIQTKPQRREIGPNPESILWVGNSFFYYNDSMHNHFGRLVSSAGPNSQVRGTSVTISGSGLDWHDMDSLLRPNGLGRYSFVGDNEIRFNKPGRQYDTAIMMDCSQCPVHPQLQGAFHETIRKYSQSLVRNGVRPVLFMSWAYKDKPEMTAQLAEQYTLAGNASGALVIPAGLAFAKAIARRPDIELYQADKRHPSLAGTYLAACTVYATLYRKSPEGLKYTAGLSSELAALLQTVAWEAVWEYFR